MPYSRKGVNYGCPMWFMIPWDLTTQNHAARVAQPSVYSKSEVGEKEMKRVFTVIA